MLQWIIKKTIRIMGNVYVFLDKYLEHETSPILEINIDEDAVALVLWHGDIDKELTDTPQIHPYSELKILNTQVGFA